VARVRCHTSNICFAVAIILLVASGALNGQVSVLTWHNDNARTGQNLAETILTPTNVNSSTFGRLFTIGVDGKVDAQPLYVPALTIPGQGIFNVLYVMTEHDSAYAFDADTGVQLWHITLAGTGETSSDDRGCGQVTPEIGITSTPAIDPQIGPHGTLYAVAMSKDSSGNYHQRLHALDLATGAELFGGPAEVRATYSGSGAEGSHGLQTFDPKQHKERPGLVIVNGTVYTSWGSHCDAGPYTGWVMGYNETTLLQTTVINLTPNGSDGGIWSAGSGPAADASGGLYLLMGNGTFETTLDANGFPSNKDYGNAFVKLATANGLSVADYFGMSNTTSESGGDVDLGSGGAMLLPQLNDSKGQPRALAVGAGKDKHIYVVDQQNLGKFNPNTNPIYQDMPSSLNGSVFSSPAWFNGQLYYGASGDVLRAFTFTNGAFGTTAASKSATSFGSPGATPSISANGVSNAILWAAENASPAVLHAYDATNLGRELYNSNQAANSRDHFGSGNKFIVPTVVDGKVYVGTTNGVGAFGLLCSYAVIPESVTVPAAAGSQSVKLTASAGCAWTAASNATWLSVTGTATGSGSGTINYTVAANPGAQRTGTLTIAGQLFTVTQAAAQLPPQAVSVSPALGSGSTQTFTLVFSDPNGAADLTSAQVIVNPAVSGVSSCYVWIDPVHKGVYLTNDAYSAWQGTTLGMAGTLQNSQCAVNAAGSAVALSGNTLIVTLALTFQAGYAGGKNIFLYATSADGLSSGWQKLGAWGVTGSSQPPQAISVSPAAGSGSSQTFTLVFSDPNGATDLTSAQMIVNPVVAGVSSCYVWIDPLHNTAYLTNDSYTSWQSVMLDTAGNLQNSQCTVSASGSTVAFSGNTLTVTLALIFQAGYAGGKNIFAYATTAGGMNSGWQKLGIWGVTGSSLPPQAVSVSPSKGSGSSQAFTLAFSDANGAADLTSAQVIINPAESGASSCYVWVDPVHNGVYLTNDTYSAWQGMALGGTGTLQNSQCAVNAAGSAVSFAGNILTVTLEFTFQAGYAGGKNIFGYATTAEGLNSGWQKLGIWGVTGSNQPPQTVSVTPPSGSGGTQTFSLVFSDTNGASDLTSAQMIVNPVVAGAASCYVWVDPLNNGVYLTNDTYSAWPGIVLGATGTLQNSQCSVNAATSSVTFAGNTLTVNVSLTFAAGYAGPMNVFGYATTAGGLNTGWQHLGTWTPH
jgi:hypothetical protein